MKVSKHTKYVLSVDELPFEIESPCEPVEDSLIARKTRKGWVVGWLEYDQDVEQPSEGEVVLAKRSNGRENMNKFYRAHGLDENGDLSFGNLEDNEVLAEVLKRIEAKNPILFGLIVRHTSESYTRDLPQDKDDIDFIVNCYEYIGRLPGEWSEMAEQESKLLWRDMLEDGRTGDLYAVPLDVYEHSGIVIRPSAADAYFPDEQWDVARGGGIYIPGKELRENIDILAKEEMRKRGKNKPKSKADAIRRVSNRMADGICQEWTSWANGDCYCIVVKAYDKQGNETDDHCVGGYIGHRWAEEELKNDVDWRVKYENKKNKEASK